MNTLPQHFNYDPQTRALDVEFGDGSVIRYFEIDPRLAFLSDSNPRRNRDFINFLQNNPVKSEMIKQADSENQPGEPQTRPDLVYQQQGGSHSKPTWTRPWGYKK